MNLSNGPWVSYSFQNKRSARDFKHSHMELQHEEYKRPDRNPYASKRIELQKQRVYDATIKRVQRQKEILEKDRLFHVYSKGIKLENVATDFPDELPDFIKYYYITCGLGVVEDEKIYNKYRKIAELQSARVLKSTKRPHGPRPASADTYRHRYPHDLEAIDENEYGKMHGKKRVRIRSAPTPKILRNGVQMVSTSTQDEGYPLYDYTNRSRSGCVYCPVECRPISSSTTDQRSSTGLQATPGPSHYQYFHYKKYFYYQRPRSAIGERMEYLDGLGVADKLRRTPRFSKFAYACRMHERGSKRTSPRSRSPRSPTSTDSTSGRRPVRQAWMERRLTQEGSEPKSLLDADDLDSYKGMRKGDMPPPSEQTDGSFIDLEDDLKYTEGMRHLAEQDHASASSDQLVGQKSEDEESLRNSRFVPIRAPTPTPAPSRSQSSDEDKHPPIQPAFYRPVPSETPTPAPSRSLSQSSDEDKHPPIQPAFYRPVPSESTDMLSGRVFVSGLDIPTDVTTSAEEEEVQVPPIVIHIRAPKPLPVKRVSQPEVHEVDVVPPREDIRAIDEVDEVPEATEVDEESEKREADNGFRTDRTTTTISDIESTSEELATGIATSQEKDLSSILNSISDSKPSAKPSRVSFDVVIDEPEEPAIVEKDVGKDALVVSAIAKEEEKEVIKIIPEVILQPDSSVEDTDSQVQDIPADTKSLSPEPSSTSMQTPFMLETPESTSQKATRKPLRSSRLYGEPDDEYLKKLLAPPDLHGFVAPVFDTLPLKPKKKKRLGSGKKKKKGKRKTAEKVPDKADSTPQEPLFTYVRRSEREIPKVAQLFNMKEDNELQRIVSSVRQFDESYKEKMKNQPWLFGRMALSKQICRFWLPMDLRDLEGISPSQYLVEYCIVCQRRRKLYSMTYDRQIQKRKVRSQRSEALTVKEADAALRSVHGDIISDQDVAEVFELLCIDENAGGRNRMCVDRIDKSLFANLCALTERIFYDKFVTEDSEMKENSRRHRLEVADFGGIEWKIQNVHVTKELRHFLLSL